MRAAVTTEVGGFEVITVSDPSPEPDQLVIRVAACGVCGSDLKAQPVMPPGTVMGHELGGEVVAVGTGTHGWREGTNVAVLPVVSCGRCERCSSGDVAHCSSARYVGMGGGAGGFAELAVIPARLAFPLPDGLPRTYAALVEPFAVGLHCVGRGEVGPGDRVLVVGAGGVGLTTLAWARVNGAERITVADPEPTDTTWSSSASGGRSSWSSAKPPVERSAASSLQVRATSPCRSNRSALCSRSSRSGFRSRTGRTSSFG